MRRWGRKKSLAVDVSVKCSHGTDTIAHQLGCYRQSRSCWLGLAPCGWAREVVPHPWETGWQPRKKFKPELPYDPAISPLGVHPDLKAESRTCNCAPTFTAALFTVARKGNSPNIHRRVVDKHNVVHPHSGVSLRLKSTELLTPAVTRMHREGTALSEISQTQKDSYCMIPLIRGNGISQNHRHRVVKVVTKGGGVSV